MDPPGRCVRDGRRGVPVRRRRRPRHEPARPVRGRRLPLGLPAEVAQRRAKRFVSAGVSFAAARQHAVGPPGRPLEAHLDLEALESLIGRGRGRGDPVPDQRRHRDPGPALGPRGAARGIRARARRQSRHLDGAAGPRGGHGGAGAPARRPAGLGEPFDELRRRCVDGGHPAARLRRRGRPRRRADRRCRPFLRPPSRRPSSTSSTAVWPTSSSLVRFVADTVLHGRVRVRPARTGVRSPGSCGERRRAAGRPTGGGRLLPGPPPLREHAVRRRPVRRARGSGMQTPCRCTATRCVRVQTGGSRRSTCCAASGVDAVVTTVLAIGVGGRRRPGVGRDRPGRARRAGRPGRRGDRRPSRRGTSSDAGLGPLDVAMAVAIPEFDGRIISVPFSFKEEVDDGDDARRARHRVPDACRTGSAGWPASPSAWPGCAIAPPASGGWRSCCRPTRPSASRLGNAVGPRHAGLVIALLRSLGRAGYRVDGIPDGGDELMAELADGLSYDRQSLGPAQLASAVGRLVGRRVRPAGSPSLPDSLRATMVEAAWGEPPGEVYLDDGDELVFSGLDLGGRPRGRSSRPGASARTRSPSTTRPTCRRPTTTSPSTAGSTRAGAPTPSCTWASTARSSGCPARGWACRRRCFPDVALGDLPLVYPFVVNDPGEGTQAKRRAHAVIVDHLLPPHDPGRDLRRPGPPGGAPRRARPGGALDPAKLPGDPRQGVGPAGRRRDPPGPRGGRAAATDEAFDDLVLHVDGYLCELKDAQIRGGLHVLGQPPDG